MKFHVHSIFLSRASKDNIAARDRASAARRDRAPL